MMEKVMIKQAIDQPRTQLRPKAAADKAPQDKGAGKAGGQEFAEELSAAIVVAPQAQVPQAVAKGKISGGDAGEGLQEFKQAANLSAAQPSALSQKAASTSSGRESVAMGPAFAGLKHPWSMARPGEISHWVFEGQDPEADLGASMKGALTSKPTQGEEAAPPTTEGAPHAAVKRGDAEAALASKLEAWNAGQLTGAKVEGQEGAGAAAGAKNGQALNAQAFQGGLAGAPTAHLSGDAAIDSQASQFGQLSGQLAEMLGAVDGQVAGASGRGQQDVGGLKGGKTRVPGAPVQTGLSGGEFLSTLGIAKGNAGKFGAGGSPSDGQGGSNAKASLRMIPGGAEKGAKGLKAELENELTTSRSLGSLAGMTGHGSVASSSTGISSEVTGHVVKGAGSEDRLSSESLGNLTTSLRGFAAQGAGGEMRIRLKPENLGELHVRVMTDGSNVGLQIQASDEKAKKILEESITHLKESMANQNLSLGTVDLTVAHSHGSSFGGDLSGQGQQSQAHNAFGDMLGNPSGHRGSHEGQGGQWGGGDAGFARQGRFQPTSGAAQAFAQPRASLAEAGRLDVTA